MALKCETLSTLSLSAACGLRVASPASSAAHFILWDRDHGFRAVHAHTLTEGLGRVLAAALRTPGQQVDSLRLFDAYGKKFAAAVISQGLATAAGLLKQQTSPCP